ncbi:LysR substrate-binding domain-containing protein [Cupriavidus sp. WGlv3]|uniref:LysR substrate-binding domain-containing protein n=1 Tax=Cupriavidus sp. WGlv3 TaxID=2919924 RepID=UPI002090198C|nr:LysR substrate-binding domain-containing protein [Cupriavidus sp. WGlv3]MCO4863817.1 LysR substrate-binding domain-containing protein [Cupriavidus sp. WGlv3]
MSEKVITHRMIEAFRAAIAHGGMSAGADALGMSQPSMSRVIAELQKAVGFPLFLKHGRTVKPTEEALALMTKVQQSFLGLDEIMRFSDQLRKQKMGRLSIATIPSIGHSIMPEAIEYLRGKYPDVFITLSVTSYVEVARAVRNRQADIGFTADILSLGDLETVAEFSADCVCIGTRKWLSPRAAAVELKDLEGKPFVGQTGTFQKRLDALLATTGVQLDITVEASLFHSMSELVLRGMGVSIVDPLTGVLHRQRGGVVLPLRPTLSYTFYATAMSDARLGKPARDLLRYLSTATEKARTHIESE